MPLWKFFAASILSNSGRGSGDPRVHVLRHVLQDLPLPAEVLHELRRQLDGVPFHALDAGNPGRFDLREQLMQSVAELVEDRDDLVVREGGGLGRRRRRQVAGQVGHRVLDREAGTAAVDRVVHPGAALLALACVQVEVELADQRALNIGDVEETHGRMPYRRVAFGDPDTVDRLDDVKQPREHLVFGKILPHFLFRERVARLLQVLAGIGQVPGFQLGDAELIAGERRELRVVALGERPARGHSGRAGTR